MPSSTLMLMRSSPGGAPAVAGHTDGRVGCVVHGRGVRVGEELPSAQRNAANLPVDCHNDERILRVSSTAIQSGTLSDPVGTHRVLAPAGALPQSAERLATRREIWDDEVRVRVRRLNLDAASYRQLAEKHTVDGRVDAGAVREEVLTIVGARGKMQNPVTGSGGMLVGVVEEVGPTSPLGLEAGQPVATLVSLRLTPLVIEDGLQEWDGLGEQVPTDGYAILFGQSIAAVLPYDLPEALSLAVMDVCGAPALTARIGAGYVSTLRQAQDDADTTGG